MGANVMEQEWRLFASLLSVGGVNNRRRHPRSLLTPLIPLCNPDSNQSSMDGLGGRWRWRRGFNQGQH